MTFDFSKKLFVSTIAEDCAAAAREHSLGLEIAEFCYAPNMDTDSAAHFRRVSQLTAESGCGLRLLLHAPFAELSPCAIDPLVRDVVRRRFDQALFAADVIGAKQIVFHSGFIPFVYYKEYFIDESVKFWRVFLKNAPNDMSFLLENVMEPEPEITAAVAEGVNDSRFGLCLDIGHANSRVSETPLPHWIDRFAPKLMHVHLHNNFGGDDLHNPLGSGNIPMRETIEYIIRKSPDATFTIENMTAAPSVVWLVENGFLSK